MSEKLIRFHFFFKAFVAYIVAHASDLMVSTDQKNDLSNSWIDWDEKFTSYVTPDTHGNGSVSDMNAAYEDYSPKAETVRIQIRDNTSLVLTGNAMLNLGIKSVDRNPSKILPPDFAPSIGFISMLSYEVRLFIFDPAHPSKKGKPKGAKFIGSKVAYTGADAAAPPAEAYSTRVPEGKTTISVLYPSDKVGKRMWIICYYMSPTGKPSPESLPFSIVLT